MEIERKFLITDLKEINLENYKYKQIIQDYLYVDSFTAIRKRHIINNNEHKYKYTIKTDKTNDSVNEIEKNISKQEYDNLRIHEDYHTICKVRYMIPYMEGLMIELDVFQGEYEGLIFAEIEFESQQQARQIVLPKWFDKELSHKLSNSMMATMRIEQIKEIIEE